MFQQLYIISMFIPILATDPSKYQIISLDISQGLFDLVLNSADLCKGPKLKNCGLVKASIENNYTLLFDIDLVESMAPTKGKIIVYNEKKPLVRLQLNNPCKHLFMRPIFETLMNVTENCVIIKGHYTNHVNIQKIALDYYGGMFLYGNLMFTSIFYNDDCNLSCLNLKCTFLPRKKKTID